MHYRVAIYVFLLGLSSLVYGQARESEKGPGKDKDDGQSTSFPLSEVFPDPYKPHITGPTSLDLDAVMHYDFEAMSDGRVNLARASAYLDIPGDSPNQGLEEIGPWDTCNSIVTDPSGNKVWRSSQRQGSWGVINQPTGGPVGAPGGGMNIYIDTNNPRDSSELYFSYNFRMKPGYRAVDGGKIPGIKSFTDHVNGRPCDGFTCGMAFRPDGEALCPGQWCDLADGVAFYYKWIGAGGLDESTCGTGVFTSLIHTWNAELGKGGYAKLTDAYAGNWMNLTLRVVLNSSLNSYDGFIEGYLNGLLVSRVTGLKLRTTYNTNIDRIKFYWFYGGGAPNFAAARDEYAEFDDLWAFRYGPSYNGLVVRGPQMAPNGTVLELPNGYRAADGSWVKGVTQPRDPPAASQNTFDFIYYNGFEDNTIGDYNLTEWEADWNTPTSENRVEYLQIVPDGGQKVLKVDYPAGTYGLGNDEDAIPGGGMQFTAPIPRSPHDEIYFSYNMKLKPGFNYVLSGEFPGIRGGPKESSGIPGYSDGYTMGTAFSGQLYSLSTTGTLGFNLFHHDQPGSTEDVYHWIDPYSADRFYKNLASQKWVNITIRVVMNTLNSPGQPGNNDGIIEAFVDGELISTWTGLRLRNVAGIGTDVMKIGTFFGGNSTQYACARDEWAYFDDFCCFVYAPGVEGVPRGNELTTAGTTLALPFLKDRDSVDPPVTEDTEDPSSPSGLTSSEVGKTSFRISWNGSTDNVGVTAYRIWIDDQFETSTTLTSFTVGQRLPSTTYKVHVTALDAMGNESQPSNSINVRTQDDIDTEVPSIPVDLRATDINISERTITVAWSPSTDNVGVTGYSMFLDDDWVAEAPSTSHTFTGLEAGREYTIEVAALDERGNSSDRSDPLKVTIITGPDTQAPTVPQGLAVASVSRSTIMVTWDASTDNSTVTGYWIYVDGSPVALALSRIFTVSGLDANTSYSISVSAIDLANNESARSGTVQATTLDFDREPPSIPTGLRRTGVGDQYISLSWNESTDNVRVAGYRIEANNIHRGDALATSFAISGLAPGLDYSITVSAFDEEGNISDRSAPLVAKTTNPDVNFSEPEMPGVEFIDVSKGNYQAKTVSELSSFGYTELEDYGVLYSNDLNTLENRQGSVAYPEASGISALLPGRISENLQVLYNFSRGRGSRISDISGNEDPINLQIYNPLSAKWIPGQGLKILEGTALISESEPSRLINSIKSSGELTAEAWIKPSVIQQDGPARIVSLSSGDHTRAFTIGQTSAPASYTYAARVNTSEANANGYPQIEADVNFVNASLHHLVYTRTATGAEAIYVNGILAYSGQRPGDLSTWADNYRLILGNELTEGKPWKGTYYLVAVYNRALTASEVRNNYEVGYGDIRYETSLVDLEANVTYYVAPFVRTNQGIVYGQTEEVIVKNVLKPLEKDSIIVQTFPNPTKGDFTVYIKKALNSPQEGLLQLADLNGQVIYRKDFVIPDGQYEDTFSLTMPPGTISGIYSLRVIMGTDAASWKLVVQNY